MVVDDDEKPLKKVDGSMNADSDSEVDEVFNETAIFMTSTSSKVNKISKCSSSVGNKSFYENWNETCNEDMYDDDDFDDCGLTNAQMKFANSFDISLHDNLANNCSQKYGHDLSKNGRALNADVLPPQDSRHILTPSTKDTTSYSCRNVPAFDIEDFSSWKDRFLVYLDGLETYLNEVLENRPFVLMSPLSTSTNPLTKPQKQWSPKDIKLANQDKRLKSIIISCLLNYVMKSVIQCTTAKAMWNDLILDHERPYATRDTKIASLRLKFNAFKALEREKVQGTFTRLKILLNDLETKGFSIPQVEVNATFVNSLPRKWLNMNQTQRANNFIKNDNLATLFRKYNYKEVLIDQIYDDLNVEEDTRSSSKFLVDLNDEFHDRALLANKKRFYKRFGRVGSAKKPMDKSNETYFACDKQGLKAEIAILTKKIDAMSKDKSETGLVVESFDCDDELVSSKDEGITRTSFVYEKTKKVPDKESLVKAIKKKAQTKSPSVLDPSTIKKTDSSTKQLILTLMEEVKGLKEQIKHPSDNFASISQTESSKSAKGKTKTYALHIDLLMEEVKGLKEQMKPPSDNSASDCYIKTKCSTCGSTDHLTKEHPEQTVVKKTMAKLKALLSQGSSSRKAPKIPKPFIPCKYCGFNNHQSNEFKYYPGCDICGNIAHEIADCVKKSSSYNKKPRIANH
ncbi:hypothetical protein Tco_1103498 [Tanacetum coccineum]